MRPAQLRHLDEFQILRSSERVYESFSARDKGLGSWKNEGNEGVADASLASRLPSRDSVSRKMAGRNNEAYIYEIYAWHPLECESENEFVFWQKAVPEASVFDAYQRVAKERELP